jgi:iron(III) transport system ATP-binding protein
LFPHLSVEGNVGFGLPRAERRGKRVHDLLDAVGLADMARRYPHQLSGGQQQRVAIARALAVDPQLVLLDEPFASLDAILRASVRADVQSILREAGATVILVTHDQDEALSIADRVAVIRSGRIAQLSSPEEIYANPTDFELARFVGDANLVDGLSSGDRIDTAFGLLASPQPAAVGDGRKVSVMIRPEQLELHRGGEGPGVRAQVLSTHFHGHDAVIGLAPDVPDLPRLTARVLGDHEIAAGQTVTITIRGTVTAWADEPNGAV